MLNRIAGDVNYRNFRIGSAKRRSYVPAIQRPAEIYVRDDSVNSPAVLQLSDGLLSAVGLEDSAAGKLQLLGQERTREPIIFYDENEWRRMVDVSLRRPSRKSVYEAVKQRENWAPQT